MNAIDVEWLGGEAQIVNVFPDKLFPPTPV